MDGDTFDDLVKRLTQTRLSRVDALRGMLASAVVGLTGAPLADETDARKKRNAGKKKHREARHGKGKKPGHDRHQKLQRQGPGQGHALP